VRVPPEVAALIEEQLADFRAKFGRDPEPDEPIFFDPEQAELVAPDPRRVRAATVIAMVRARTPERLIYGFVRTDGLLPNEIGYANMTPEDRAEWDNALAEYERDFSTDRPPKPESILVAGSKQRLRPQRSRSALR